MLFVLRHEGAAEAEQIPIGVGFDFVNVGKIFGRVRADGVAFGVAVFVAVKTEFERFGAAPFFVKNVADQVENHRRANRQPITFRH